MMKWFFYLVMTILPALTFASDPQNKINACALAASLKLGANVAAAYPQLRIKLGPDGVPFVPVGSKAFAYWRERTPSWIPDQAFVAHYLNKDEWRRSIALQSAQEMRDEAVTVGRAIFSKSERNQLEESSIQVPLTEKSPHEVSEEKNEAGRVANLRRIDPKFYDATELKKKWDQSVANEYHLWEIGGSLSLGTTGYLYVEGIPGHKFIFFFQSDGMAHSRAAKLTQEKYPNAKIIFGGSITFRAKKHADGSYSLIELSMEDGGWIKDYWMHPEKTYPLMLLAVRSEFNVDYNAKVKLGGDWPQYYENEQLMRDAINSAPLALGSEMQKEGFFTWESVQALLYNIQPLASELIPKITQPGHDDPSLGFLCFKRPGQEAEFLYFPKTGRPYHQYAYYLVRDQYPGTELLFGGSLLPSFKEDGSLRHLGISGDATVSDPKLEGASAIRALLSNFRERLNLVDNTELLILDTEWKRIPVVTAREFLPTLTVGELNEGLKLPPGPERDRILQIDPVTGRFTINTESPEYKAWRLIVAPFINDSAFPFHLLRNAEKETVLAKQEADHERQEIKRVEEKVKFVDIKAGHAKIKIPDSIAQFVKPISEFFVREPRDGGFEIVDLKYAILHLHGEFFVVGWNLYKANHGSVIPKIIDLNPDLKIIGGDIVSVNLRPRKDKTGKLERIGIRDNGGSMLLPNRFDTYFESDEWRDQFYNKTQVSENLILKHQILTGLGLAIDSQTLIENEW